MLMVTSHKAPRWLKVYHFAEVVGLHIYQTYLRMHQDVGVKKMMEVFVIIETGHTKKLAERIRELEVRPPRFERLAALLGRAGGVMTCRFSSDRLIILMARIERIASEGYKNRARHADSLEERRILEEILSQERYQLLSLAKLSSAPRRR